MSSNSEDNFLIPSPSRALSRASNKPGGVLSRMTFEVLSAQRSDEVRLQPVRFRIGDYEFNEPDFKQVLLWAQALDLTPELVVEHLASYGADEEVGFSVENGSITRIRMALVVRPDLRDTSPAT